MAAEWGILGVLGLLIAMLGSGWTVVRALARASAETVHSWTAALLPAIAIVLGCWGIAASDLPLSQWSDILPYPIAASLVAAGCVSVCRLSSRTAQVILFAGMIGFFVHCADEISPSLPGTLWPFWAMVALAMAWNGPTLVGSTAQTHPHRRIALAVPVLAIAAALAVAEAAAFSTPTSGGSWRWRIPAWLRLSTTPPWRRRPSATCTRL